MYLYFNSLGQLCENKVYFCSFLIGLITNKFNIGNLLEIGE